jgi:cytochrome oxidase Cu insertion factor (SCO1/SenC/PrrC family)
MSDPQAIGRWATAKLLVIALALLAGGAGAPATAQNDGDPSATELMDALMWGHEPVDTSFSLTDHHGKRRTHEEFRGKALIVYFGYMFCPDICPTDLQTIAQAIDQLGPKGEAVQPLFITLDPDRDTSEALASYVSLFHPQLVGLTGVREEIRRVARGYKVYFARVSGGSMSAYVLDHSAFIYLVDAAGRYVGFLPPGTTPERLAEAISPHLTKAPR